MGLTPVLAITSAQPYFLCSFSASHTWLETVNINKSSTAKYPPAHSPENPLLITQGKSSEYL